MKSEERREKRYQRRHAQREKKKINKMQQIGNYNEVFAYDNLYKSFYLCRKGVRWKSSIQRYEAILPIATLKIHKKLQEKKFQPLKFKEFDIFERGKIRHIRAVNIDERCSERVLCDKYLIPVLAPKLIYDNGASLKGRGTDFALNRLKTHLLRHYKKYGNTGYIFQFDFSKYFDNINHKILISLLSKDIKDKDILAMLKNNIDSFGEKGLGLGSQVSQICAVYYPTLLDRYFKEVLKIKGYGRYMDDGYAICKDLKEVKACQDGLRKMAKLLDITINDKKVSVTKLSSTFIFLKKRINLTTSGQVIIRLGKKSIHQARRRLVKMFKKYQGRKDGEEFIQSAFNSWYGMSKGYKNYYVSENYRKLYETLKQTNEENT